MINVNREGYLQGVVDVYRCRQCRKLFCEDRRYGEPLLVSVGFEEIPDDEQWAILTCTDTRSVFMKSFGAKLGKRIVHTCKDGEVRELVVKDDWTVEEGGGSTVHRLHLVRDHINTNLEAGYYKLRILSGQQASEIGFR